jgi:hypothetical protein
MARLTDFHRQHLSWLIYNTWSIIGAFPVTKGDLCPLPKWVFHVVIMSREWLEEAESFAEVIRLPTRLRTINCMVIGMDGSFGYDPGLGINIISSSLVQTQLSEEPLSSSQKWLHVTHTQSLDCRGILRAALVCILYLDFHVFDLPEDLSHNIIIGRPIIKILEKLPRDQELELKVGCWGIGQKPYTLETLDLPNSWINSWITFGVESSVLWEGNIHEEILMNLIHFTDLLIIHENNSRIRLLLANLLSISG